MTSHSSSLKKGGKIKANKTILAMVSKVFRNMFFKDKSAIEMVMEDTTRPPFQIMLDAIYSVKPMKESLQGKSVDEIFAVLYLVKKYEIPKLQLAVMECLSSFPITENNVLKVATDSMEYLTPFEEAAQSLLLACAKFLKTKVSDGKSFVRFVAENGDRMVTVHQLAVLMEDSHLSDWCDGCKRKSTECLDGKEVSESNVKVGVKVEENPIIHPLLSGGHKGKTGVLAKKEDKDEWFIHWETCKEEADFRIKTGGYFLFKCQDQTDECLAENICICECHYECNSE